MNETIETLLAIQDIEAQIWELKVERDKRPEALRREESAVAAGEAVVEKADKLLKEEQVNIDRHNKILMGREEEIKKLELQMLAPKITNKEYRAIQNQTANVRAENALTEEDILEGMERTDERQEELEAARRDLMGHEAALDEARGRVETEVGQFDARIEELQEARRERAVGVTAEVMRLYDRVAEARGSSVVASVAEGFCQGCYMTVTTQDVSLILRGDKLQQCKTCQRILYVPNPGDWIGG